MIHDLQGGAALAAGIDHPAYRVAVEPVPGDLRRSLLADLG
jgi:superfamily II helicase